jgi:hypothetical protein
MGAPVGAAGIGLTAIGTGVSIYSQIQQAKAQERMLRNQAQVAAWQRSDVLRQGAEQASMATAAGRQASAGALAAMGANNIESTSGSARNIFAMNEVEAARDAATIKANAIRQAWGIGVERRGALDQAKRVRRDAILGALGTGLSGLGSIGAQGYGIYNRQAPAVKE